MTTHADGGICGELIPRPKVVLPGERSLSAVRMERRRASTQRCCRRRPSRGAPSEGAQARVGQTSQSDIPGSS